jgi:hypothetical protein
VEIIAVRWARVVIGVALRVNSRGLALAESDLELA